MMRWRGMSLPAPHWLAAFAVLCCETALQVSLAEAQSSTASFATWTYATEPSEYHRIEMGVSERRTRALEGGIIGGVLFAALGAWLGRKACLNAASSGNCAGGAIIGGGLGGAIGALIGYGFGREIKR